MKPPFEQPELVTVRGEAAGLSGPALLALIQAVISKGKLFRFQAPGNSMHPFIRNGDILTLAPLKTAPFAGDILAFCYPSRGNVVVHRAVQVRKSACLMRGDAIPGESDGWVSFEHILGRVVRIQRGEQEIHFGMGPERRLIAFLSAHGWLLPIQSSSLLRTFGKRIVR